jgi:mono/diheme cytochrome c family protein
VRASGRLRFERLAAAAALALALAGSTAAPQPPQAPQAPPAGASARGEAAARDFCGSCHAFPPADILPRGKWNEKILEMTSLAVSGTGARPGQTIPLDAPTDAILAYYAASAPTALAPPDPWPEPSTERPVAFSRKALRGPAGLTPFVANVRLVTLTESAGLEVVAADMTNGLILRGSPRSPDKGLSVIAKVPHPCHVEAVDLDNDGIRDLLVADLGSTPPGDHALGGVVWLRGRADGTFAAERIASGLPRVADAQAADFDGDGDLDVVVAAFGWRETGSTLLLENRTSDASAPLFVPRQLDWRQGAIHVPVADLDRDGRPDFVALISQHHETAVAFLNQGKGVFAEKKVHAAPHPGWGYSGLQLTDFDKDGDTDALVTNGDMFDEFMLKPYHGIAWLENRGDVTFRETVLAPMSGVHRALAGDLDGDGDQDVVAAALLPGMARYAQQTGRTLPSLVWLEQVARGRFERRTLECCGYHASMDLGDVDQDGDLDIVTGTFQADPGPGAEFVEVWLNQGRPR